MSLLDQISELPFIKCKVRGCWVWTCMPTRYITCPFDIWDEHHDRWFGEHYGSTAQARGIASLERRKQ
jgi:hypothetical protein